MHMKEPKTVVEESDSEGRGSVLESSIKPEKLHMNINSILFNQNSKNRVSNQVMLKYVVQFSLELS